MEYRLHSACFRPMMVNAQRVTCIGYSLADAKTTSNGKPLQPEIKKQAIK